MCQCQCALVSDVFDHGAVDFVRHVLQVVHHTLKVVQDFRRDPEVQRPRRSLHLVEAAARGIMQVVCLALAALWSNCTKFAVAA